MKKLLFAFCLLSVSAFARWYADPPRQTVVGIMDYGMDCTLLPTVPGRDFVDNDNDPCSAHPHAINTAGILNEFADNIKYMPLRVLNDSGIGTEQQLIDAINFAKDNGADIIQAVVLISSAWGIPNFDQPNQFPALCQAIEDSGLLFITVAGNEGVDLTQTARYPAHCNKPNMIVVAGTDQADMVFTSFPGDINAPGNDIELPTGGTGSGASWAAPQVTATAVREYQTNPELDALQLKAEVLEHLGPNLVLNTFYPPEPPPPPGEFILDITATINISNIDARNPIQSKQEQLPGCANPCYPGRGYVFEIPAGSAPRNLTLENWPTGETSPTMIRGNTTLQENTDYTVRVTHDGETVRLYLNGVLDGEGAALPPNDNGQTVRDCRYRWSASYDKFFNGSCQVQ